MAQVSSYDPGMPAWVDLATSDPASARQFYGALFGWDFEIGPEATGFYTYCLRRGLQAAGLNGQPATTMPTTWITYLATADAEETAQRVTEAGGTIVMGPIHIPQTGSVLIATDPTGAMIGAWQPGSFFGATIVDEPGSVTWNELATRDLDTATEFYSAVFGVTWEERETGEDGPRSMTFSVSGRLAGGAVEISGQGAELPPHWMPYFAVEDLDAALEQVAQLGGSVGSAAVDSPFGRFAVIRDPQGGVLTIMGSAGEPAS